MPLAQHMEGGHGEREPGMKIGPDPVHDLLAMADERQHREHRLDEQTVPPLAAFTQFEVARIALSSMETGVAPDNHAPVDVSNQPLKRLVRHSRVATIPPHHQAIL